MTIYIELICCSQRKLPPEEEINKKQPLWLQPHRWITFNNFPLTRRQADTNQLQLTKTAVMQRAMQQTPANRQSRSSHVFTGCR